MIRLILLVVVALLLVVVGLAIVVWLFKRFALGLFGIKARALHGANMVVHAIRSIPKPTDPEMAADDGEGAESELHDYFAMDVTIKPRIEVSHPIWEPGELMLTSEKIKGLAELEDKQVGTIHSVEVWNGTSFEPDDESKYPGEQRLKIVFGVKPGTAHAWLHYYNEPIGALDLPVGTIDI